MVFARDADHGRTVEATRARRFEAADAEEIRAAF